MRVSPVVSRAPALLTVMLHVEPAAENRFLEVIAESPEFYSSSRIQLEGMNSPRVNIMALRNLPTGVYQVTGVLVGANGRRTMASQFAEVVPSAGSGR
jgi:hypothetical protein